MLNYTSFVRHARRPPLPPELGPKHPSTSGLTTTTTTSGERKFHRWAGDDHSTVMPLRNLLRFAYQRYRCPSPLPETS
jgi:hypothetical protein